MIDVRLVTHQRENKRTVSANGHAGFAVRGADVVCAGVSAMLYGFLYYLSNRYGDKLTWSDEDGKIFMCFPTDSDEAFDVLRASLSLMADSYPQYVRLQESR